MSLVRRLALALVLLPLAATSGEAQAGEAAATAEPAPASTPDKMNPHGWDQQYLERRKVSKKAAVRSDGDPRGSFSRIGCMTDPTKCTCQSEDAKESSACGDVLGYFCPESTMKYLAASCMDLFGGAVVCNCASAQQIESHLKAESAGSKKAPAKKKSSSKKKSSAKKK